MTIKKYYKIAKKKLFPLTRSLTGQGVKKTLYIIQKEFPKLKIKKLKSGTKVFDWNIPEEWNVRDAYIIDKYNNKIIDFKKNNLHLVGYSIPVKKNITKKKLFKNLYFLKRINVISIYQTLGALVVKLVDTKDLKSLPFWECQFESGRGHH